MNLLRKYIRSLLIEQTRPSYDELYEKKMEYWDEIDMMTLYMTNKDKAHRLNVEFIKRHGWAWSDYISAQEARLNADEESMKTSLDQMKARR